MTLDASDLAVLLKALHFSADKHRTQRRKDALASPYINHPIEVAHVLAGEGGVTDLTTLVAAILHDTIEDTCTTPEELETAFGPEVRALVEELTDDKSLPKLERKRIQIERTPETSTRAKQIKLADKISNIRDVIHSPPAHWPMGRRIEYLDWTEKVIAGCRGSSERLETLYDAVLGEARQRLRAEAEQGV
jgi:guanosine-3',5'-bis(diphosphate) 3'-pyrophosphohydrolase